jgi:hypothetical protein
MHRPRHSQLPDGGRLSKPVMLPRLKRFIAREVFRTLMGGSVLGGLRAGQTFLMPSRNRLAGDGEIASRFFWKALERHPCRRDLSPRRRNPPFGGPHTGLENRTKLQASGLTPLGRMR